MDYVLTKASSGSRYLPKQNFRTASDTLIHLLIQNFQQNFSYSELLQFVKCHWNELNQKDVLSISSDRKSVLFTESSKKAIVILAIKGNDLQSPNELTCEQIEIVLKDLTQEDKKSLASKNALGENDKNQINEILKNPNDCKNYFQNGIDGAFTSKSFGNFVDNDQADCIIPSDLFPTINSILGIKDALSFSSTCKKLYLSLNLTLGMYTWRVNQNINLPSGLAAWKFNQEGGEDITDKLKFADELISRTNKRLPEMRLPSSMPFAELARDINDKMFFTHLMKNIVDLYLHLRKNPESVNSRDQFGSTLLHYAVGNNERCLEKGFYISELLFNVPGANFNIKDSEGNTPLHTLLNNSYYSVNYVQFLVNKVMSHGFDPSITNEQGKTILHLAARKAGFVSLILSILNENNVPNLRSILDTLSNPARFGIVPNATTLATALHICIVEKSWGDVLALLNAGANLDLCDNRLDVLNTIKQTIDYLSKGKGNDVKQAHVTGKDDFSERLTICQALQTKLSETSNCIIS